MTPKNDRSRRKMLQTGAVVGSILVSGVHSVAGQQAEEESNDSRANATPIEVEPNTETRVNGRVGPDLPFNSDPEDWLTFQAQREDRITIDISGGAGPVELIDPDGNLLDTTGEIPSGDRLQATAQQSGAFFIHLTITNFGANQGYGLTIQLLRDEGDTTTPEDHDTTTRGGSLLTDDFRSGAFDDGRPVTWQVQSSGDYITVQSDAVKQGSNALEAKSKGPSNNVLLYHRSDGFTVGDGDVYSAWLKCAGTVPRVDYTIGTERAEEPAHGVRAAIIADHNNVRISTKDENGDGIDILRLTPGNAETWYYFEWEIYPSDAELIGRIYDSSQELLGEQTLSTTGETALEYTNLKVQTPFGRSSIGWFDDVTVSTRQPTSSASGMTYELGTQVEDGRVSPVWQGRAPAGIKGETNPPLQFSNGFKYEIVWENLDGKPHNFVIEDREGNQLVSTDIVSEQGATQTVEFEPQMGEIMGSKYYCATHPSSMQGDIQFAQKTPVTQILPGEEQENNESNTG